VSLAHRQRFISEAIRKYEPAVSPLGGYFVRDADTKVSASTTYETKTMAETQCRMLAAADIESHYAELMLTVLALLHGKRWDEATATVAKFVQQSGRDA
jgi:hypothetical protein